MGGRAIEGLIAFWVSAEFFYYRLVVKNAFDERFFDLLVNGGGVRIRVVVVGEVLYKVFFDDIEVLEVFLVDNAEDNEEELFWCG